MKKPVLIIGLLLSIPIWGGLIIGPGHEIGVLLALLFPWPLPIVLLVLWLAGCLYLWRVQRASSKGAESPRSPLKKIVRTVLRSVLWLGVLLLGGIVLFFFVVMYPPRYESSYRGKVIDAETGAPIAGAVVLGVWYREYPTVAGGMERYHDAREVVTNANGDFTMPGKGLLILSNIVPARVFIFKAGYEYWGSYFWEVLKESRLLNQQIRWEEEKAIIQLKKLTLAERKKQGTPPYPDIPKGKRQRLTEEINKDRIERGLNPL
jgi:hypothetical protein